jgi:uncharacterized HAD superfamily protein
MGLLVSRNEEFKKHAVVWDLDNTLANVKEYEEHHKHRHEGYAKEALDAAPIKRNIKALNKEEKKGDETVILTGRSASYNKETKQWLKKHKVKYDKLIERPSRDTTETDKKMKKRLLTKEIMPKYHVDKAIDDKKKNRKMFRKEGIKADDA